jgi:hypothetical protein
LLEPAARKVWKNRGRGRVRRKPGVMNGLEARYAQHLEGLKVLGQVEWYEFDSWTFKLADDCRYTPDFAVMLVTGMIELHEVKGHWEDDARVKIKVAASKFPFKFVGVTRKRKKDGGGWQFEEF